MPKIAHYRSKCIGCNACVQLAEKFFKMKEGRAFLINSEKKTSFAVLECSEDELKVIRQAADACPMGCIKINP